MSEQTTEPEPASVQDAGPQCALCGAPSAVQWQRRLTEAEKQPILAAEQARRDEAVILADPSLPPPVFGPMPDLSDYTASVYACGDHGITLDLAAHIHQSTCTAPVQADLPGCSCTPEPLPDPEPEVRGSAGAPLPDHWVSD